MSLVDSFQQTSFSPYQKSSAFNYATPTPILQATGVQNVPFQSANDATLHIAYKFSDQLFAYGVVEGSQSLGSAAVQWQRDGVTNVADRVPSVQQLDVNTGAGRVVAGAVTGGARSAVLTPSDALISMLPSLRRMAEQRRDLVLHVAAQTTRGGASALDPLVNVSDLSDLMNVGEGGVAVLLSGSAQEAHDMALVAHLAARRASTPMAHAFDGVVAARTQSNTASLLPAAALAALLADAPGLSNTNETQRAFDLSSFAEQRIADAIVGISSPGLSSPATFFASPRKTMFGAVPALSSPAGRRLSFGLPEITDLVASPLARRSLSQSSFVASDSDDNDDDFVGQSPSLLRKRAVVNAPPHRASAVEQLEAIEWALARVGNAVGRQHAVVEYIGPNDAETVVVVPATASSNVMALVARQANVNESIGILKLRVVSPFPARQLVQALPRAVKVLCTLQTGDAAAALKLQRGVLGALRVHLAANSEMPTVLSGRVAPSAAAFDAAAASEALAHARAGSADFVVHGATAAAPALSKATTPAGTTQCVMWTASHDGSAAPAELVRDVVASGGRAHVSSVTWHDAYALKGDTAVATHLRFGPWPFESTVPVARGQAQVVAVDDARLFEHFDAISAAADGATLLVAAPFLVKPGQSPGAVASKALEDALPADVRRHIADKALRVYVVDVERAVAAQQRAVLQQRHPPTAAEQRARVHAAACVAAAGWADAAQLGGVPRDCLVVADVPLAWNDAAAEQSTTSRPSRPRGTTLRSALAYGAPTGVAAALPRRVQLAWARLFPTQFRLQQRLFSADHETFEVTVALTKRLTPANYERNVFHLELDIGDSGLRYAIGDALGVAGHNEPAAVDDFLSWYGVAPDELLALPVESGAGDQLQLRTAAQAFTQSLDLFGKPTKTFYASLAPFATNEDERGMLARLGSADGKELFEQRAAESITIDEVLREFTSAHPSAEQLAAIVPPIKMRHYSIASSQRVHPTQVHLLVVVHDWVSPSGVTRRGQCSNYLARLQPGDRVVTAVKPSVMRLPADPKTPIVMAGLGTGQAPFRAFWEERMFMRQQGIEVGPMALYFGSRSRRAEYLYGDELEALSIGSTPLIDQLRLAFSRDQPEKIYIQHLMQQDGELLSQRMLREDAVFYLCGPTWPVPNVRQAFLDAFEVAGVADGAAKLEELKANDRWILEVY